MEEDEGTGDGKGRRKGGKVMVQEDEKRILWPKYCETCGEDRHEGRWCLVRNLRCNYPPCVNPDGHATSVCRDMMKRCILPVCNDQRGHKAESHWKCPTDGTSKIGTDRAAADYLKTQFRLYKHHLTDAELDMIKWYESKK